MRLQFAKRVVLEVSCVLVWIKTIKWMDCQTCHRWFPQCQKEIHSVYCDSTEGSASVVSLTLGNEYAKNEARESPTFHPKGLEDGQQFSANPLNPVT